jgi:septal ring factor EnvC (AmiA/AmiB activator)
MATAKRKGKPIDPISDRARALNDQIAALESEIKKLDTQIHHHAETAVHHTAAWRDHCPDPRTGRSAAQARP